MSKNIYVGNLPWGVSDSDLQIMFEAHGTVKRAQVITDRETGRSRGFGFVEMENDNEALQAIEALHGSDLEGRPLTVNEARQREERAEGSGRSAGAGGGRGYGGNFRSGYAGGTNRGRNY